MPKKGPTVHITDLGPEPKQEAAPAEGAPEAPLNLPPPPLVTTGPLTPVAAPVLLASTVKPPAAWPVYLIGSGAAAITALTPVFYVAGFMGGIQPLVQQNFLLSMVAIWAALPAIVILMAAYMLQQGRRLAAEARHSRDLADRLLAPTALAAAEAGEAAELLRSQIADAADAANLARDRLGVLRQALTEETQLLLDSSAVAARAAADLSGRLGQERSEMASLGESLDTQSSKVAEAIGRQAQMVAEASDLAEAQLREAEAVLAARAADLAAAAGEAHDAARIAGEDLGRQVSRLETAGLGVGDQMRLVGETITAQRAALVTAAHALRAEQEDFAVVAETRNAQLSEFIVQARLGATEIGDSAGRGAQALGELIDVARQKIGEFAETAQSERDALAGQALSEFVGLGERFAESRRRLREEFAALNAEAGQALEIRMSEAREVVEASAAAIEQAGAAAAQRLDQGLVEARRALVEMQKLMAEIDDRAARLPQEAKGNLAELREAVGEGIDEILAQARRAAQETQAIDEAFHERVKRNYEMLSEAVKLMGAASQQSRQAPTLPADPIPAVAASAPISPAAPAPAPPPTQPAGDLPLRGRLRFSPADTTDDPLEGLAEPASRPAQPTGKPPEDFNWNWSWKEVISDLSREEAALGGDLAVEIRAMGIDADALLPKSRVEDIAAAYHRKDLQGAREAVHKLAPAAIRRLVRRLFSDLEVKARSERFLQQMRITLDQAASQQGGVVVIASLLTSDVGRSFLLLDAASGDST